MGGQVVLLSTMVDGEEEHDVELILQHRPSHKSQGDSGIS